MKNSALLLFLILFTTNVGNAQNDFSSYFEKRTLRIDFSLTEMTRFSRLLYNNCGKNLFGAVRLKIWKTHLVTEDIISMYMILLPGKRYIHVDSIRCLRNGEQPTKLKWRLNHGTTVYRFHFPKSRYELNYAPGISQIWSFIRL